MQVIEIEDEYGLCLSKRQKVVIDRGQGVFVWDEHGNRLIDFTSGWGVTCLGHNHPVITEALLGQAGKILQNPNSGFTYSPARALLLNELVNVVPAHLSKYWFANSGAEANDAALKIARKVTGRQAVLALKGSFHGRTLAALSVSGGTENSAKFLPRLPDHSFVCMNDKQALEAAIDDSLAAVMVELVQGEGGVRALDKSYVSWLGHLCRKHGVLLIVDEVQTGFCRTGDFFACNRYEVRPDIMTMGKGIAGGLPFAALAMTDQVAAAVQQGDHGGTYCGNPLVCAVSAAVVRHLRECDVASHVRSLGSMALEALQHLQQKYPDLIVQVRGEGLMLALELADDSLVWPLTQLCLEQGVMVTPTKGAVVRLLPSLLLTAAEWSEGFACLQAGVGNLWASGQWASMRTA